MANTTATTTAAKNIVFVHPDLGIGGAERLVIDAAVGLQSLGHKVTVLTSYRDTNHCFEEARDGKLQYSSTHKLLASGRWLRESKAECRVKEHSTSEYEAMPCSHPRSADGLVSCSPY